MGKYPNSPIHSKFSDWHIKNCNGNCYLTDADVTFKRDGAIQQRLWAWPQRSNWPPKGTPLAVADLKYQEDVQTPIEFWLADWYENVDVPYYTMYVTKDFKTWKIIRHKTGKEQHFNEKQMIAWINGGLVPFD